MEAIVIILMVALYTTEPLQFSVFPGLLLLVTLYRLSLNIASTRLILGDAYAGEIITAFGTFVVKGNYVVGFVMFVILVVIQFVVITKVATRIAEGAARVRPGWPAGNVFLRWGRRSRGRGRSARM